MFPIITCMEELMIYMGRVDTDSFGFSDDAGESDRSPEPSRDLPPHFSHKA
jgi:hypothetical protein